MEKVICKSCGFEVGNGKSFKEYPKRNLVCCVCGKKRTCKPLEAYFLTEADIPSKLHPQSIKSVNRRLGKSKKLSPTQIEKKKLIKENDRLWSKIVRRKAGDVCVVDSSSGKIDAHHLFSRRLWATRWDTRNGVSLCVHHHIWNFNFSAHKTPEKFRKWYMATYGEIKYLFLKRESQKPVTRSLAFVKYWNEKLKTEATALKIDF
jgi:hypothetical protein